MFLRLCEKPRLLIQAALVLCWPSWKEKQRRRSMGNINNILDGDARVRHAASLCSFTAKTIIPMRNRAVVLLCQEHSQQLKWVAGFREVTQFGLCDSTGADVVLRPGRSFWREQTWCVSNEQCFVRTFWSFSVISKVELEQTIWCSGHIDGKDC